MIELIEPSFRNFEFFLSVIMFNVLLILWFAWSTKYVKVTNSHVMSLRALNRMACLGKALRWEDKRRHLRIPIVATPREYDYTLFIDETAPLNE